jgi:hypothetical protein
MHNVPYEKITRSGNGWTLKLSNGTTLKAKILVHAGSEILDNALNLPKTTADATKTLSYQDDLYRTSVTSGYFLKDQSTTASFLTLAALLPKGQNNLIMANTMGAGMLVGQAAGGAAAYCAFFDKKTTEIKLKEIQGEVLKYRLNLMPYSDITLTDPNWKAMQVLGTMGILKAAFKPEAALFNPDQEVTMAEISEPMQDLFYKAQIWFDDHSAGTVTLENTISMISYIGNRSVKTLPEEIEKKWKNSFQFKTPFDLKKVLNRRQFSVLVNEYLQPLVIGVDESGRIIR